jgi:hypothetical protein
MPVVQQNREQPRSFSTLENTLEQEASRRILDHFPVLPDDRRIFVTTMSSVGRTFLRIGQIAKSLQTFSTLENTLAES